MSIGIHGLLMGIHIAAGLLALPAGAAAAAARKGGRLHTRAGTWFVGSMLVLGVTAAILEPFRAQPEESTNGMPIIVVYFVATAWVAARRRDGVTGRFEIAAGAAALGMAALTMWGALDGATTPAGPGPMFAFAGLLMVSGLGDLRAALCRKLTPAQRLSRHVWRICFAFFIATGSFFLGQQDVLPEAVRGSPLLFVLAFAPFAIMVFWLLRLRFAKAVRRLVLRIAPAEPAAVVLEPAP